MGIGIRPIFPTIDNGWWKCDICSNDVGVEVLWDYDEYGNRLMSGSAIPSSRYWHGVKRVAYCSPGCSLKGHSNS